MRKTLPVLALLALTTLSRAGGSYTTKSTTDVSWATSSTAVSLSGFTEEDYVLDHAIFFLGGGAPAGSAAPVYTFAEDGSFSPADASLYTATYGGGTTVNQRYADRLVLGVESWATLSGTEGHDIFLDRAYGHRAFLTFTNGGGGDESVSFTANRALRNLAVHADTEYDFSIPTGRGDAVLSWGGGEFFDVAGEVQSENNRAIASFDEGLDASLTYDPAAFSQSFMLASGASITVEVFAFADGYIEDDRTPQAVPEPAAFLPLGLGALALLRRRR